MDLSLFIARRMSGTRRRDGGGGSPGVAVATAAIALSVAVMLVAVGVSRGFQQGIIDKVTGFDAQITLSATDHPATDSTRTVALTPHLRGLITECAGDGATVEAVTTLPAIVRGGADDGGFKGMVLASLPAEGERRAFLESNMKTGSAAIGPDMAGGIIVSQGIARSLGLGEGDRAEVSIFVNGRIRTRRLDVRGIYETGMADYDERIAFVDGEMLRRLTGGDDRSGTAILIGGLPDGETDAAATRLRSALTMEAATAGTRPDVEVSSIHETAMRYFSWLSLLDTNVAVIIALMAVVAAFTLSAGTFIIILESTGAIATLKSLGMTDGAIRRIYVYMGLRIAAIGLIAGNGVGLALMAVQNRFRLIPLDPETYYLSYVPVELSWVSFVVINVAALVIAAAVLLIPTKVVCRMSPARVKTE